MAHPEDKTIRLTAAQATILFLKNQYVSRDGEENPFFAGAFGIFGHGNIGGIGQALQENLDFRYYIARNEQAMVHSAAAYAKMKNRMQTLVCTASVGPGSTNMVTAAAAATINRVPVLLLPGDIFARRNVGPVLQQVECETSQDVSVNDSFKCVSKYWDRINRPDQILTALPEAMRVLTSAINTGAVTICFPEDVQTEAYDYPETFFRKRVWRVARPRPDSAALEEAIQVIKGAKAPMIVAGGGVLYSDATKTLEEFVNATGIPVGETMGGKGSLNYDHPLNLGAIGTTGTFAANRIAEAADVVIGIGTRYQDFTTASKTAWQNPNVRFVNINITEFDSAKHYGVMCMGDAKVTLEELSKGLSYKVSDTYRKAAEQLHNEWEATVDKIYTNYAPEGSLPSQGELIGLVNDHGDPRAVMVCAAGSLPGDLHKVWRTRHPKQYHMEYGYSCMGYEVAGGLGVKMADPSRPVYVMVGDGSFLMMCTEITTSVQEGYKLTIVLMNNHGFKSIGALSRSLGQDGFGTRYCYPEGDSSKPRVLPGDSQMAARNLADHVDLAAVAQGLGAVVLRCKSRHDFKKALDDSKATDRTTVIYVENDRYLGIDGHSWWDVPPAEVSTMPDVQASRAKWEPMRAKERFYCS